jgi:hypothetical protein
MISCSTFSFDAEGFLVINGLETDRARYRFCSRTNSTLEQLLSGGFSSAECHRIRRELAIGAQLRLTW